MPKDQAVVSKGSGFCVAFVKTNRSKGREYYSICESYRENGKVRHRTLETIGTIEDLKEYVLKGYLFMKAHEGDQQEASPCKQEQTP